MNSNASFKVCCEEDKMTGVFGKKLIVKIFTDTHWVQQGSLCSTCFRRVHLNLHRNSYHAETKILLFKGLKYYHSMCSVVVHPTLIS